MHRLFGFILSHCGGGAAPSPLHPPTRFYFLTGSSGYLLSLFFSGSFYLYWYPSRLVPMCFFLGTHCGGRRCALPPAPPHPLLCFNRLLLLPTLTSFFAYASFIWVHLIALRGEAPAPPHPLLFFNRLLWLPTLTLFFLVHLSLLVSIETCAYVLLSWYALRGEVLRPPPCTPPTRFYVLTGSSCYLLLRLFCICIVYLGSSYRIAGGGACTPPPVLMF